MTKSTGPSSRGAPDGGSVGTVCNYQVRIHELAESDASLAQSDSLRHATRITAKLRILDSDALCTTMRVKLSLGQGLHWDLLALTLFWSNLASQAPVNRFFCDAAAMRLRFGCDAKRESLCEMIDVITLC